MVKDTNMSTKTARKPKATAKATTKSKPKAKAEPKVKAKAIELITGQIWQMEGSSIKIGLVGKRLVHYKHYLGDLKRAPVSLSAKDVLEKHLKAKKAVLTEEPKA